ncbi:MAG: shikimate dehydrogenase [Verrucomicrobiales bacterium]|nr:shikimate dehydrogenase [Verrucomicrobiota bacterium JB025]
MKDVYRLEDLVSREVLDAGADKPARLAVLGWPVKHSASPRMHQPALDAGGMDVRYIRLEVEPGRIPEAFERMRALGFLGCNVTVPHKLDALENCDEVDGGAKSLGAVNTVVFGGEKTLGFNTDGPGFARAVEEEFGRPLAGLKVVIAGAGGGAGQAIATQCVMLGVPDLLLVNRTVAKLETLAERLGKLGSTTRVATMSFEDGGLAEACRGGELIVNTSSIGLKQGDPPILTSDCLRAGQLVYDCIYAPPVTPLLALAEAAGCRTANGFSMLLHQGALAFQRWFPGTDPLEAMRAGLAQRS